MDLILQEVFDKALLLYRLLILKHGNKITIFVIITTFLSVRSMKIVVNGQTSNVREINAGVIQSSLLGPTLFLHFINDLPGKILRSLIHIYTDDATVYGSVSKNPNLQSLTADLSASLAQTTL